MQSHFLAPQQSLLFFRIADMFHSFTSNTVSFLYLFDFMLVLLVLLVLFLLVLLAYFSTKGSPPPPFSFADPRDLCNSNDLCYFQINKLAFLDILFL